MTIEGTNDRDTLRAEQPGDVVYGFGGNDFIFNNADGTTLIGGAGNDQYRLFSSDTTIIEEADGGHDTIWAYDHVTMPDHVEDLVFKRVAKWHAIRGNDLDNMISAGDGEQAIRGAGGNDTLIGGGGRDSFVFGLGDGHDTIMDYTPGEDDLAFWSLGVTSLTDLMALGTDTDDGYLITFSAEQSVLLKGVRGDDLSDADLPLSEMPSDLLDGAVLTFEDSFDSEDSLTNGQWNTTPSNGHPVAAAAARGSRFHTYVDENSQTPEGEEIGYNPFSVTDGVLSISATRTPDHLTDELEPWLSGLLETHGTFEQTYGYFEVRARTPEGQGFWPAFWLMPADFSWPPEADILEILGSRPDIYRAATHTELWGDKVTAAESWLVPDTSADFHTYGLLWTPEKLIYTFDGRVMMEVPTPPDMHSPHAIRLNLALGGWDGDPNADTPDGGSLDVDYVRAYQIPGIEALPRNTDFSDYADVENGVLNINEFDQLDLYGDDVRRLADDPAAVLAPLEAASTATLVGNQFDNELTGNDEGTVINGKTGNDTLSGNGGDDYLIGEDGNDVLEGGTGQDTLVGGLGDDTYIIRRNDGSATRAFELILEQPNQGYDTLYLPDFVPTDVRTVMDWARWHIVFESDTGTQYISIKATPGIGGNDVGSYIERVEFGDGTVWDMTGALFLHGDDMDNVSSGSRYNDTILGAGGDDTLIGMDGDDDIDGGDGVDDLYGWNGNDTLRDSGSEGGDRLMGEAGNDVLQAGRGLDFLFGGAGRDSLFASSDGDNLDGGDDADYLRGRGAADTLDGGAGDDTLLAAGGDDLASGGAGNDMVKGAAGNDTLSGGDDRDRLIGGLGADSLSGDAGADTLHGGNGADRINGGAGRDIHIGGEGEDVFVFAFSEIERDVIRDFEAGDQIEVHVDHDPSEYSISLSSDLIKIQHTVSNETVEIFAHNVTLNDVDLL